MIKAVEVIIQEKRYMIFNPEKIEGRIASLNRKITNSESNFVFFQELVVYKCDHCLMLLYFFNNGMTLSRGRASTDLPFLPFIVSAMKSEFKIASSVASMAAINKGDVSSFLKILPFCNLSFDSCHTRTDVSVENAMT